MNRRLRDALNESAYVAVVILSVFCMTDRFAYGNAAILTVLLGYLLVSLRGKIKCPRIIVVLIGYGLLILVQMIVEPSAYFSLRVATKELSRLCMYVLVILVAANARIREERFLRLWSLVFLLSGLIAVFQSAKLAGVDGLLRSVYGDSVDLDIARKYSELDLFRAGSVFINSNTYAKFILAFACIFLAARSRRAIGMMYMVLLLLTIVACLLLTGSRTGIVIAALMLAISYWRKISAGKGRFSVEGLLAFSASALAGIVGTVVYVSRSATGASSRLRALMIVAGFSNSMAYKIATFRSMMGRFSAMSLCIGLGCFETDVQHLTLIDFDLGYLITFYGICGCVLYLFMIREIWRYRKCMPYQYLCLNRLLVLVLFLFGLTGGMFFHLRTFTVFATIAFADIADEHFEPIRAPVTTSGLGPL